MPDRGNQSGSAATAALAITGAIALSVAAFFLFTLPASRRAQDRNGAGDPAPVGPEVAGPGTPSEKDDPPQPPQPPQPPEREDPPAPPDFHSDPGALVGEIARLLAAKDFGGAQGLLGEGVGGGVEGLGAAFGADGYTPAGDHPPVEIGLSGEFLRWAIPVRQRAAGGQGPVERVYFDLAREVVAGGAGRWVVRDLLYPEALAQAVAAAVPAGLSPEAQRERDALVMADGFIAAVTGMDFVTALDGCADSVPEERIAGLCIVFEEGEFELRESKPLVATALRDDTAWVIAHVESTKLGAGSEFGLEMKRAPGSDGDAAGGRWQIVGINFGKLLDTYVAASEAGKVPYTPIKSQPGAGEKLVLYFEYDNAQLLPRAKRQLEIIANILKADSDKTLTIAGHADALGSEQYNARLSAARAAAVKAQLVEFGVPDPQVSTEGFGERQPWKPNLREDGSDDPKGRSYNRRAEIYLEF